MLLSLMRRHAKSWLIKFLIGIIAVVFIFYFGYSFTSQEGVKVASVNGETIGGLDYQKAYRESLEALQRQYKGVWNENLIKAFDLKNQVLDGLINQKLVTQEAKRLGLDVTEKEIQNEILSHPAFQFQGRFDENRYRALLEQNRMAPEDFEANVAQELLQRKLSQFLSTFFVVSEQEVLDYYKFFNTKLRISYVKFLPEEFKKGVSLEQDALASYFNDRRESYRIPEKIRISYIEIDPKAFEEKVEISDNDVLYYYEENLESFKEKKQVRARHVLFKLDEDAPEGEVEKAMEKAREVIEKAGAGEDFAELAKKYSEGPTAKDGGDLGFFSEGQMVKAFEEQAFKMKEGEISPPVRTPFGIHVIKTEAVKEARTKPLEEARPEILKTLTRMRSLDMAHEKALSLIDQMPYDVDLVQYARAHDQEAKQSDYFARTDTIPGIGGGENLKDSIFSLGRKETSDLLEYNDKFYIVQVTDKQPSRLPELQEVEDRAREDFLSHMAVKEAVSAAEAYLEELKQGEEWTSFAKEKKLSPETTDFFTRKDPVPGIGHNPDIREAAFDLTEKSPYPDKVFEQQGAVYVIRWAGEKGIEDADFMKEKEDLRRKLESAKQQRVFDDWLKGLRERAEIEIFTPGE